MIIDQVSKANGIVRQIDYEVVKIGAVRIVSSDQNQPLRVR